MKEIKLEIRIYSLQYDELTPQDRELMTKPKKPPHAVMRLTPNSQSVPLPC